VTRTHHRIEIQWNPEMYRERPGQEHALVESSLAQSLGVKGNRNDPVDFMGREEPGVMIPQEQA
jgi:hypothetical protein